MSDSDPLGLVGKTVSEKYRVEQLVGEGGFAFVYRAMHLIWNKPVAIKFFSGLSSAPEDQRETLQRDFINEGALLTELSSQTANIVQARDVGTLTTEDGTWLPYMVLEWLDGKPLDIVLEEAIAEGRPAWSLAETFAILSPAAAALDVAHNQGIVHRDIKPPNIFVLSDPRAEQPTVKVLDFGVAKMMTDNTQMQAALAKTGTTITSFTPQYGAPEQFSRSYGATGPWTDVFALALVAVEMLAGRVALDGGDMVQLAFASSNPETRPTPRALGVTVSDQVETVFAKAVATSPNHRYESMSAFWADFAEAVGMSSTLSSNGPMSTSSPGIANSATVISDLSVSGSLGIGPQGSTNITTGSPSTLTATPQEPTKSASKAPLIGVAVIGLVAAAAGAAFIMTRGGGEEDSAATPAGSGGGATSASASVAAATAPKCPQGMVLIPAGQYFMGSDAKTAPANEKPAHNVKLDAFCFDLHEVTMKQYKACSDAGKCKRAPKQVEWPNISEEQRKTFSPLCNANAIDERGDHPVNCVDWPMAKTYCESNGKRLPTEAEWEYATRGPDGRIYPWGDAPPTEKHLNACGTECVAWGKEHGRTFNALYDADDGYPITAPVGKFPAGNSKFGPSDVVGNVFEWVADWMGEYSSEKAENPTGAKQGERRVIRGGAFNGSDKTWLRPSFRFAAPPKMRSYGFGFRCAGTIAAPDK